MTKDEIFQMAREVKFAIDVSDDPNSPPSWRGSAHNDTFEAFAKLVAAKEREACAKTIDITFYGDGGKECAEAIRARGQA